MPEWLISLIGVTVGIFVTELRHWLDRGERFRVMSFDKRLEAHQEAFNYCVRVLSDLRDVRGEKANREAVDKLGHTIQEAHNWWAHRCLYLDFNSRVELLDTWSKALDECQAILKDGKARDTLRREVDAQLGKTLRDISKGVGAKYLPETEKLLGIKQS